MFYKIKWNHRFFFCWNWKEKKNRDENTQTYFFNNDGLKTEELSIFGAVRALLIARIMFHINEFDIIIE